MALRLTKARIEIAAAEAMLEGKTVVLWELEPRGMAVAAIPPSDKWPAGRTSFFVQRRVGGRGSKQVRYVFGQFPDLDLVEARKQAFALIANIRNGIDITRERKEFFEQKRIEFENQKTQPFEKVFEAYRKSKSDGSRYWDIQLPYFQTKYFNPQLGKKAVTSIDKSDIKSLLNSIDKLSMRKKAEVFLKPFWKYLIQEEIITVNPMSAIAPIKKGKKRRRVLNKEELRAIWKATLDLKKENNLLGNVYQLLLLTGQRFREISNLEKRELNLEEGIYTLRSERSKNREPHIVHLTSLAIENLTNLPNRNAQLVFANSKGNPLGDFGKQKIAFDKKVAAHLGREIEDFQIRDLRRTYTSICASLGIDSDVTELVLNHVADTGKTGVKDVYQQYDYMKERKECMEVFTRYIKEHIAS